MQLTKFGGADPAQQLSKEDERSAALARRAQMGDYDDGELCTAVESARSSLSLTCASI
jgi:hypothetical protein